MGELAKHSVARWAALLGLVVGLGLLAHGAQVFVADRAPPVPYRLAVIAVGLAELWLARLVLRRSRAAWSFFVSINGTLFVVGLFAGPKLRDTFEIPLALALVPCLLFGAACALATLAHDDF